MAVLKLTADNLMAAEWGDSDELEVGALVWALGSPLGLQQSVTFGILSGKHRSFSTEPVRVSGDSGDCPRFALSRLSADRCGGESRQQRWAAWSIREGKVVGINTAIVGEAYQGISFAIPSSMARPIYERIRREGRVNAAGWAWNRRMSRLRLAKRLGLEKAEGALVTRMVEDPDGSTSPAQAAGLHVRRRHHPLGRSTGSKPHGAVFLCRHDRRSARPSTWW